MQYDAVIVGSGASGGWVAMQLTRAGLNVAVLEAGRALDPAVDYTEHKRSWEMPLRGQRVPRGAREEQPIQSECYQCDEYAHHLFIKDTEHPYTTPKERPFKWIRCRQVGGKSITWGRQVYRLSDYDLKAASRDGYGVDWPIGYVDLAPYYDRVERFIGVSGQAEGLPQLPDGQFQPAMDLTCGERLARRAIRETFGRTLTIGRVAILTADLQGRPTCHYCGPCGRGCTTRSYYSSPNSTLPAAEATGRLTLITNAVVSHVTVDKDSGRAAGIWYVDRLTRAQREITGRVVIMCASTLESTRILLNSTSPQYPNGLGNSSGVLGHYLMDHITGGGASGVLSALDPKDDTRGNRPNGIYIARFRNVTDRHPDFIRGYGFQGGANIVAWGHAHRIEGFGPSFKRDVRESRPWTIHFGGFGEALPRFESHCRIDDRLKDAWGIPALHIDLHTGDNERRMIRDMAETAAEMLEASGATEIHQNTSGPGGAIHEVGTARMGDDAKTSFVNRWQQSHAVKNLFLMDGSVYPSSACQNPTITIMALASRACDYLVEELRAGRV